MAAETELAIKLKALGAEQAAAALQQVAGAENAIAVAHKNAKLEADAATPAVEALANAQKTLVELQKRLAEAQKTGTVADVTILTRAIEQQQQAVSRLGPAVSKSRVSFEAMSRILGAIDPQLASMVGDVKGMTELFGGLSAATLTAGLGFSALVLSIRQVLNEIRLVREEFKAITDEATKREHEEIRSIAEITRASASRPEGKFSAEEQAQAEAAFRAAKDRVGDQDLLKKNVAALAGVVPERDIQELTLAGAEFDPQKSRSSRNAKASRELQSSRTKERANRERERIAEEERRRGERALEEITSEDILEGRANVESLLDEVAPGQNKDNVRDIAKRLIEREKLGPNARKRLSNFHLSGQALDEAEIRRDRSVAARLGFEQSGGTDAEFQAARQLVGAATPTTNNNTTNNVTNNTTIVGQQRNFNNGRQAQKEATSNGETRFANK